MQKHANIYTLKMSKSMERILWHCHIKLVGQQGPFLEVMFAQRSEH